MHALSPSPYSIHGYHLALAHPRSPDSDLLGLLLAHLGLLDTGAALGIVGAHADQLQAGAGIAFIAFLVGYFLHLCADGARGDGRGADAASDTRRWPARRPRCGRE
ncbi:MAG TPA: hypothetical protein VFY89_09145, partial [Ktedonobacterales bacterium]